MLSTVYLPVLFLALSTLISPVLVLKLLVSRLKLRIVHHNDMMYRLNGYHGSRQCTNKDRDCQGGAFHLASAIMNLREDANKTGKTMLYLYAGNSLGGSIYNTLTRTEAIIDVMNYLSPDVMCLGMNDFDYGVDQVKRLITKINAPIVSTNIDLSKEKIMKGVVLKKSFIRKIQNIKVGFVGYSNAQTPKFSNSHNIIFEDELDSIRRETSHMRNKGVQFIIAIGNSNYDVNKNIAKFAPLVDVVVSGSSYFETTKMWHMDTPEIKESDYPIFKMKSGKKIALLQLFGYTKYLGVIDMVFDEIGILISHNYTLDRLTSPTKWGPIEANDMQDMLEEYTKDIDHKVVGHTKVQLNSDGFKCYYSECLFGNMITNSMVDYMAEKEAENQDGRHYWTSTPIAIVDAGTMSNALGSNEGNVTNYELHQAINNLETVKVITVSGKVLYTALERNVLQRTLIRNFLHTSGLRVIYDFSKRAHSRVLQLKALCGACWVPIHRKVKMANLYNIIIPSFTLNQVQGLQILKAKAKKIIDTKVNVIEMVTKQFEQYDYLNPRLDRRIIVLNSSNSIFLNIIIVIVTLLINSFNKLLLF